MNNKQKIICIIGPTASGKSAHAVALAHERNGEVISVDSRQVYRTLDIGTEKTSIEEMSGIPHHLIDIREPEDVYTAGDFVQDATKFITEIALRGKTPILCGGTHFYFDALIHGLPAHIPEDTELRATLEKLTCEELFAQIQARDPRRALMLDPKNKRRLIRACEILAHVHVVPERVATESPYDIEWVIINPEKEILRTRIDTRLTQTLAKGLIEEVRATRARVGDSRLNELGLEYRVIGEYLRGERTEDSLFLVLSNKLWQYARQQKKWIKKLATSATT